MNSNDFSERDTSGFRAASVSLENFRNYEHLFVDLGAGFNVVHGANAQGKTNFLEAVYLLSSTRILRGFRDIEAIREGSQTARVQAIVGDHRSKIAVILQAGSRKRAQLNDMNLPRAADLIGKLPCVCVSSADLSLVAGEPSDRRLFLDFELSQLFPAYLHRLANYRRALDQRNALLKHAQESPVSESAFEPWEAQMAEHGAAIRQSRHEYVTDMIPIAASTQFDLSGGESLTLEYVTRDDGTTASELLELMASNRRSEIGRGSSNVGPHRDDVLIQVGGREARLFGSQGQQRTAMISIKLATLALTKKFLGSPAILLLDDIFSDLDERRRGRLTEWIPDNAGQTILTCTEAKLAGPKILGVAKMFNCCQGELYET